jgi:hypothetical protein
MTTKLGWGDRVWQWDFLTGLGHRSSTDDRRATRRRKKDWCWAMAESDRNCARRDTGKARRMRRREKKRVER